MAAEAPTQANLDARFLMGVIRDNDRWNSHGITEGDISIVFEMSALCGWGATFSRSRFRDALRLVEESGTVAKRGDRWFTYTNPTVETIDEEGIRVCARKGCNAEISHLRADARFCSPGCRNRASRRQGSADYPLHRPWSGRREMARNRESGTSGRSRHFSRSEGTTAALVSVIGTGTERR